MSARPNVVVFFTDQQRWDTVGLHGNPLNLTPHFDRLARAGAFVKNCFTCQPVCGPARACLQTGQYATTAGVWRNGIGIDPGADTLAKSFAAAGYRTGYIGKWHLAPHADGPGAVDEKYRAGYQDWLAANALEHTSDAYETTVYDNDGNPVELYGYRVDALTDAGIRYAAEHRDEPFFLTLSFLEPHHQNHRDDYPAPDGYESRYAGRWMPADLAALPDAYFDTDDPNRHRLGGTAHRHMAGYLGMVKRLDEALGRMTDALKSMGILDNTIIMFISDHGCHFKTRNREYKRSCHDASIHVPCFLHGPGFEHAGELPELISLVDLPPTLLDAAGLDVPASMQGRSLMPLVRREKTDWPAEAYVQISESGIGRAIRTDRWTYAVEAETPNDAGGADTYTEAYLYDLQADPHQLDNLITYETFVDIRSTLRERLLQRIEAAGEPRPTIVEVPTIRAGQRRPELGGR